MWFNNLLCKIFGHCWDYHSIDKIGDLIIVRSKHVCIECGKTIYDSKTNPPY